MTVTENDRIRLLKVIRKEAVGDCNMMIISELACAVFSVCTMFCIVGTAHIPLLSIPVFCSFYENLGKIYQEVPRFPPFIQPFTPLIFAF